MPDDILQIASLLDKLRREYPLGIPEQFLTVPAVRGERQPVASQNKCLFIVVTGDGTMSEEDGGFLNSIAEKGLGLAVAECERVVLPQATPAETISSLVESARAVLTVIFGGPCEVGTCQQLPSGVELHAHPLSEIRSSPAIKKAFWELLRGHRLRK